MFRCLRQKMENIFEKFPKYKGEKNNVKLSKFKYSHGNLFQANLQIVLFMQII